MWLPNEVLFCDSINYVIWIKMLTVNFNRQNSRFYCQLFHLDCNIKTKASSLLGNLTTKVVTFLHNPSDVFSLTDEWRTKLLTFLHNPSDVFSLTHEWRTKVLTFLHNPSDVFSLTDEWSFFWGHKSILPFPLASWYYSI